MPKVSVIVPVYGVEKYIERCARSLFNQTLDDIEYIFVNDCTIDQSIAVLQNIINDYPQRKNQTIIINHNVNQGLPIARRTGIKMATGDYIAHCDSDDWVDTDMYRAMYENAKQNDSDISICDYQTHDGCKPLGYFRGCNSLDKERIQIDMLYQNVAWSLWNKLFKRSLYEKIQIYPKDAMGEDMVITMQLMACVKNVSYVDSVKYYYFINQNSITKSPSIDAVISRFKQYLHNYEIIKEIYKKQGLLDEYKKEFVWLEYSVKAMLNHSDQRCRVLWKTTFPNVEYKVLFDKNVSFYQKKNVVKSILKHFL